MFFAAISNRKINAFLVEEMFNLEVENTIEPSKHQELLTELEQLQIDSPNETHEVLLKELQQNQQKVFNIYCLDCINYSLSTYLQTLHYKNAKLLRNKIKHIAIWFYDVDIGTMRLKLRR